jgi:hypothetical protein
MICIFVAAMLLAVVVVLLQLGKNILYRSSTATLILKEHYDDIFDLWLFFHQKTRSGALIHELKPFCIWLRIRTDTYSSFNSIFVVSGVNDIAHHWLAVSMTPPTIVSGVNDTAHH